MDLKMSLIAKQEREVLMDIYGPVRHKSMAIRIVKDNNLVIE